VDIVSSPAATNGLFFSQLNQNKTNTMTKEFALYLGLPETATEAEVKVALEAKCKTEAEMKKKMEAEAEMEAKKKLETEAKDGEKKFSAEFEAMKLELSAIKTNTQAAKDAAHKAEVEGLKLEAAKDGKVIPMGDEALMKLSIPEIKDMIVKLPKGQVKLARGNTMPVTKDGKKLDKRSDEFKAYLSDKREEGALALGRIISGSVNLNK
jgi:membrane protein involved in colicin uptake